MIIIPKGTFMFDSHKMVHDVQRTLGTITHSTRDFDFKIQRIHSISHNK